MRYCTTGVRFSELFDVERLWRFDASLSLVLLVCNTVFCVGNVVWTPWMKRAA